MKNLTTKTSLYLINNPHVYGMAIAWALKDVLGWEQKQIFNTLMTAHTKGMCKMGEFSNAHEIISKIETLLAEEGVLQKVVVLESDIPRNVAKQDKNDLVQKLAVIPEHLELHETKLLA